MTKNRKKKKSTTKKEEYRYRPIIHGDISEGFELFLLGDAETGWVPKMQVLKDFAQNLRDLEYPKPFMVYHYGLQVEEWAGSVTFKLGDPKNKWIPTQENLNDFVKEFENANPKFPAFFYSYAVDRKVIELARKNT